MGEFDRVNVGNGQYLSHRTYAHVQAAEQRSGVNVYVIQGSFKGGSGASASAGTHDKDGVFDVWPYSGSVDAGIEFMRASRFHGGATWVRNPSQGSWPYHIHGIDFGVGDARLASLAAFQVKEYRAGRNGLGGYPTDNDPYTYRPDPIQPFDYQAWITPQDSPWSKGEVYVSKLHKGRLNSDSVRRLQYRLKHHAALPNLSDEIPVNGDYYARTEAAVQRWQHNVAESGPNDGTYVSAVQANRLFGDNYRVIED